MKYCRALSCLLLFVLCYPSSARAQASTIALVQRAGRDAGSTTTTSLAFASSNTVGNWIAVAIRAGNSSSQVFTVSDSNNNTYRRALQLSATLNQITAAIFYAENIKGGTNTVTVSDTVSGPLRIAILEYSGVATSGSLDVWMTNLGTGTAANSNSVITTANGDLLLGEVVTHNNATFTAGSGYAIEEFVPVEPNTKLIVEDQIQGAAGSASAGATLAISDNWGAGIAAFKAATAGGPVPPNITSLSQTSGPVGTPITITGTNFGSPQGTSTVTFNGTAATPTNWGATSIAAPVPAGAMTGPVVVTVGGLASNGVNFTVTSNGGGVATPTFSPGAGTYNSAQTVTISSTTSGATICYTTDGTMPAASTPGTCSAGTTLANGGTVTVGASETLQALGTEIGFTNSAVGSASYTINTCLQNLAIGNFTLCGESYKDVTAASVTVNYSPSPGNAIIAWATWCFESTCHTSISGITATIGDNINATESCFVASPHSPFITDASGGPQGSGDFQEHYVWYCPTIPSGVTSFTMTPSNPNLSFVQLNISEWKAGSLAASCSPISLCFENVDNFGQAGNTTGTTATITTSGSTVNANDLIFAVTEVPCCSFTASPGTGYTGITVAPSVTPGMVSEAEAVTATGVQTATTTWTGGSTHWFGVIVPIKSAGAAPVVDTPTFSPGAGTYSSALPVTISSTTSGATICYTTDGTMPAANTPGTCSAGTTLANGGTVTVGGSETVQAIGTEIGFTNSTVGSAAYVITVATPTITSLNPTSGPVGTGVTITGMNFDSMQGTSTVTFNGTAATPTNWSTTSIVVPVPAGATTGNVVVTVGGTPSNGATFTVTIPPSITSLNPTSGSAGTSVTITGMNFDSMQGTSTVTFNGTTAAPTNWSTTSIVVPVPAGATTGNVVVTVGGTPSNGATFTVSTTGVNFPIKVSANRRYFTDSSGVPWFMVADAMHRAVNNMPTSSYSTYLNDRASRKFNAIDFFASCGSCSSSAAAFDGTRPFTSGTGASSYDLSTPNNAYWSEVDSFINIANSLGMVVFLRPLPWGNGWATAFQNNGATKVFNFGAWLGSRYQNANIIWGVGMDFDNTTNTIPSGTNLNLMAQFMAGIKSTDHNHILTSQNQYQNSYSQQANTNATFTANLDFSFVYTYLETYNFAGQAYNNANVMPVLLGEDDYEGGNITGNLSSPANAFITRMEMWWLATTGGTGAVFGNHNVEHVVSGWQNSLNTAAANQAQYLLNLYSTLPWQNFTPDQTHRVVTGGFGTSKPNNANLYNATYATTTWDGSQTSVTYTPVATTLSVNMANFARPMDADWYDPTTGNSTAISGSPFANSGSQSFTTPGTAHADGTHDWVLVLH